MQNIILLLLLPFFFSCKDNSIHFNNVNKTAATPASKLTSKPVSDTASWAYFLQHLPEKQAPVLDYRGMPVPFQQKHFAIISYDVGTRDLQQCADALMRLRAEYLFSQHRFSEIGFHFVSGNYYRFTDYCNGRMPLPKGDNVVFTSFASHPQNRESFRRYLDIVYSYASTISLAAELKTADDFAIGTIIIHPGSPGHCFIITDEATAANGDKLFKLVEGYMPAQSIYVLQNLAEPALGYWHRLHKGPIETASYDFDKYEMKKFE